MSLPDDIIEDILKRRDVYVLNFYEPNFDMSRWKCLGVFNTELAAKRAAARIGLRSIDNFNMYDPAKRYCHRPRGFSDEKTWVDRWAQELGMCVYTIETRRLDDERMLPQETLYFNLDAYLKRLIVDRGLSSRETKELLVSWKNDPPYDDVLLGLFSTSEESFRPGKGDMSREAWLEKHEYVESYPFAAYDPI
jgi:hypothetical protein